MYRTTFDGSRQSDVVSPVLTCLSKNGDNVGVGRHVGDMSATYPTKGIASCCCALVLDAENVFLWTKLFVHTSFYAGKCARRLGTKKAVGHNNSLTLVCHCGHYVVGVARPVGIYWSLFRWGSQYIKYCADLIG